MISPSNAETIRRAGTLIREGRLVAFPTETVYGLGANALDAGAVERIFRVKGRPSTSPVIVHVASVQAARELVTAWPPAAEALARRFWPGPLTLVLSKRDCIPSIVTAGLPTAGLRVPANPVALELLKAAGTPIAAPSANRFSELSPTAAAHVHESLGDQVDLILDGGPAQVGIESTVLSLAGPVPLLLRPGMISQVQIEEVIGAIHIAPTPGDGPHLAPGMHAKHYSPRTPLLLRVPDSGRGAHLWLQHQMPAAKAVRMPADPAHYAALLYKTLHSLDQEGFDWIAVEVPPNSAEWAGIRDRLNRAAAI